MRIIAGIYRYALDLCKGFYIILEHTILSFDGDGGRLREPSFIDSYLSILMELLATLDR